MNLEELKVLLGALEHIRENGPVIKCMGLCDSVYRLVVKAGWDDWKFLDYLKELWKNWPEFSGQLDFPVPHSRLAPDDAYISTDQPWSRQSRYGQARWRLLDWLINEVKEQINEQATAGGTAGRPQDDSDRRPY